MGPIHVYLNHGATESQIVAVLDELFLARGNSQWAILDDSATEEVVTIRFYDDHLRESDPEELNVLRSRFSGEIPASLIANVSGRHDGTPQVRHFVL
jgi:hypothetical protein